MNSLRTHNIAIAVYYLNNDILVMLTPATQLCSQVVGFRLQRNSITIGLTICVGCCLCAVSTIEAEVASSMCTVALSKCT